MDPFNNSHQNTKKKKIETQKTSMSPNKLSWVPTPTSPANPRRVCRPIGANLHPVEARVDPLFDPRYPGHITFQPTSNKTAGGGEASQRRSEEEEEWIRRIKNCFVIRSVRMQVRQLRAVFTKNWISPPRPQNLKPETWNLETKHGDCPGKGVPDLPSKHVTGIPAKDANQEEVSGWEYIAARETLQKKKKQNNSWIRATIELSSECYK